MSSLMDKHSAAFLSYRPIGGTTPVDIGNNPPRRLPGSWRSAVMGGVDNGVPADGCQHFGCSAKMVRSLQTTVAKPAGWGKHVADTCATQAMTAGHASRWLHNPIASVVVEGGAFGSGGLRKDEDGSGRRSLFDFPGGSGCASVRGVGVGGQAGPVGAATVLAGMDSGQLSGPGVCATSGQCFRACLSTSAQGVPR